MPMGMMEYLDNTFSFSKLKRVCIVMNDQSYEPYEQS